MSDEPRSIRPLDEQIQVALRPRPRQMMLSHIKDRSQFAEFFTREQRVQVVTPRKQSFGAHISVADAASFMLTPLDDRPPLQVGENLLVVFQRAQDAVISQAVVVGLAGVRIRVSPLDLRSSARFKTRLACRWSPITAPCRDHLAGRQWTIVRDAPDRGRLRPGDGRGAFSLHESVVRADASPVPIEEVLGAGAAAPERGLLIDVSLGGFCMLAAPTEGLSQLKHQLLFRVEVDLPHVTRDHRVEAFAAARHFRLSEEWSAVHCMLLERLPQEILLV